MQMIARLAMFRWREEGVSSQIGAYVARPHRGLDKCGDHAARFEIAGTSYQVFLVVHVLQFKLVQMYPDRPMKRQRLRQWTELILTKLYYQRTDG